MNAVIYTRFSPRRNAEEALSCETQEAQCRAFLAERGWTERSAHRDEAVSGGSEIEEREGLMAALAALKRGDALVVVNRDRLARDATIAEIVRRTVARRGARIEAVGGDVVSSEDETPTARLVRRMLDLFAQFAREEGAARTRFAMLTQQRSGKRMSRHPPYGMQVDPADPSRLVKNPREQPAVTRVLELAATGLTAWKIARTMTEEMPDLTRGERGEWTVKTVQKILTRK